MKISTFISILLVVGGIFFLFASMVAETNTQYPDADINSSIWSNKYNYADRINTSIAPIQQAFVDIEDDNLGWFTKLVSGIAAIPRAIITLPILIFSGFAIGGEMITGFATAIKLPAYILQVILVMLIAWGLFKLVDTFARWNV